MLSKTFHAVTPQRTPTLMSTKGTVLIIEDNMLNLDMAKRLLEKGGYKTLQAEDADNGIELALAKRPDLILMDMHLPIKNGYDASRILKSDQRTRDIPIVAFTALAMEEEQAKAIESGCSGVISKPINVDTFAETVSGYLRQRDKGQATPRILELAPKQAEVTLPEPEDDFEQFLLIASHDLQGPIRKILLFQQFLQNSAGEKLDPEEHDMLEGIARNGRLLEGLLGDLLTLSRAGRPEGALQPVSLNSIIEKALEKKESAIRECGAKIDMSGIAAELPELRGNYQQLVQAFTAILDNALKFRKADQPPIIQIGTRKIEEYTIEITIRDNGIGLDEKYASKIFQPFQRLTGGGKAHGRGLGLSLARKIIRRHDGNIRVTSQPGKGACFSVLFHIGE
jgi:signal transduction histidine kinase